MMIIPFGPVVASREFISSSAGKEKVVVALGKPRKISNSEWCCRFRVRGLGNERIHEAYGIDACQALLLAFEGIREHLISSEKILSWEGREPEDIGIPRFVPSFYGLNFSQKLESIIDREVQRFGQRVEAAQKKSPRPVSSNATRVLLKKRKEQKHK